MNVGDYLSRRAVALGLVTEGLIKTDEQIEAEKQQQQMMAAAQTFGPDALKLAAGRVDKEAAQMEKEAE